MVGPLRRDKLALVPMYAEMSQRPPPPRPFLNLLRSPVHPSLRRFVRTILGLSTIVVGAFFNTRHQDLSSRARRTCRAQATEPTEPSPTRSRQYLQKVRTPRRAVPGERLVLLGLLTSRPHFGGFVAIAPVRNGIVRRCCRRRTPKRCARLGYPPQNPWRTGEVLAVSGNRQSRSPLCAARHGYRGRASGVGPATNRCGRRLRRLVRRVRAECAACGVRGCPGAGRFRCGENCSHHCGGYPGGNNSP
jgi:hypothetical protein